MCAFKGRSNCSALITLRTMADECWHCLQNIQGLCSVSQGVTHDKVKSLLAVLVRLLDVISSSHLCK